ncbi:ABC transporter permease [Streptomyces sodiiphilus]|uniref:Transport permease protein n=1 Tax=Streptomyces sodiiphilus TaxID=226217 RepID=A0ABN2P266_9ACTN
MSAYTALTEAAFRAYTRDKTTMFFTFAFPMIFLVVFGALFSGQEVPQSGKPYINYIAPGVLSWGIANAAVFGVAFMLMQWRRDDILRLIRMTPAPLTAVLGSRYGMAVVIGILQGTLFVSVATLPFFGLQVSGSWPLAIPVVICGVTAFMAIGAIIGSYSRTPEAVAGFANFLMVPMAFLSGSFFPLDAMPSWMQTLAWAFPLRYINDGVSTAVTGSGDLGTVAISCGALTLFTMVLAVVVAKTFRWSNQT